MQVNELNQIFRKIEDLESEAVDLMKILVSIKALGPLNNGKGEAEKAEFLEKYLNHCGIMEVQNYPSADKDVPGGLRPNLVARIPGQSNQRTIWILAHLDVVPEGDLTRWNTNPFEAVVKEGKIYGRGTEDNHQGLVSAIIAARAFQELNIKPHYDLGIILVSDEETGSKHGLQFIVHNHQQLFRKEDLILVPDAGESDGSMIEVAEKSILWLKFKTNGKQVHASVPEKGINAFRAASDLVVKLAKLYDLFSAADLVFDPPVSTFEPTKKEANVPNVNTIPGEDIFYLDCRILPQYEITAVLAEMRKICAEIEKKYKVQIEVTTIQKEEAAPPTSSQAQVVKALQKAIQEVTGIRAKAMGIGGGTVAAIFRKAGYQAAVWSTIADMAHQPNEYCIIKNLITDAKVFAHVCLQKP